MEKAPEERRCSVVVLEWLPNSRELERLGNLKRRYPHHPVVLVTRLTPENARLLKDVSVEEVVWLREAEQQLAPAIRSICKRDFNYLRCLVLPIQQAEHLPAPLRGALSYACENARPVRSVKQLASAVGYDRRTLWQQWAQTLGPALGLRLEDFLHWLLLLRATSLKTPGRSWAEVAEAVGVHPSTLWRQARQLTGLSLDDLARSPREQLAQRLRDRVFHALLGSQPSLPA